MTGRLRPDRLTAEQEAVVTHVGPRLLVVGGPATGRTTSLVARFLAGSPPPSPARGARLLVVARRAMARRIEAVLAADGHDAAGSLSVVTVPDLAADLLRRHGADVDVLTRREERLLASRLLAREDAAEWPTLHPLLRRPTFLDEVVDALAALDQAALPDDEVRHRATAVGPADRWDELLAFRARWQAAVSGLGQQPVSALVAAAGELLTRPDVLAHEQGRLAEVLVDDADVLSDGGARLLHRLVAGSTAPAVVAVSHPDALAPPAHALLADLVTTATTVTTSHSHRPAHAVELVVGHHPALEAEAVAGELLAAHDDGVPWDDMAVLVRRPAARGPSIARALARHGIPVAVPPVVLADEPVVRAVLDLLRWAEGDAGALERLLPSPLSRLDPAEVRRLRRAARADGQPVEERPEVARLVALRDLVRDRASTSDPGALLFAVWEAGLVHLAADGADVADERALDALMALSRAVTRSTVGRAEPRSLAASRAALEAAVTDGADAWPAPSASVGGGPVALLSIAGAAGHHWHTVVVAGCLDGELPATMPAPRFFDHDLLTATFASPPADRRRRALDGERRLFSVATSRATARTVLVAAPPPGVLVSRFADHLPARPPRLPVLAADAPSALAPTPGAAPVWPDGRLRLSATQLETYDDCPRRYAYEYVLHLRRPSGAAADLGSLVHRVLAAFLDPDRPGERTRDALLALAEEHWRDDLAPYRPQVEELRRDYVAMLDAWWEAEPRPGAHAVAVERRFEVDVGPHQVKGAIDVVERSPDGEVRILDFKTGKSEPGPDEVAENLQLATYHLAARRDPELAALGDVTELALVFLRSGRVLTQEIADDHEARTETHILATADEMLAEAFAPSVDAHCDWCALQRVCPLWPEGRQVAPT